MSLHVSKPLFAAACALFMAACTPTIAHRGQMLTDDQRAMLQTGMLKADIKAQLGSPTSIAAFDPNIWFYIGEITEQSGLYRPEIRDRRVTILRFDSDEKLAEVKDVTQQDAEAIAMNKDKTPTAGHEMTILEQLVGNVGRFSGQEAGKK